MSQPRSSTPLPAAHASQPDLGEAVLDALPGGALVCDDTGRILASNHALEPLIGRCAAELAGRLWREVLPELDTAPGIVSIRRADATVQWLEVAVGSAPSARGELTVFTLRTAPDAAALATLIEDGRRTELLTRGEREVFECIAGNAPLPVVLEAISRLLESAVQDCSGAISVLGEDGRHFEQIVAPRLPDRLRSVMLRTPVGLRNGSCAAAVYLGRQVLVANLASDPLWQQRRTAALDAGLAAAWSSPIIAASGRVIGALALYRRRPGLPPERDCELMTHAARLASIAIERSAAEQALRASEAKFRGLYESMMEGVFQSSLGGELQAVNPAFVNMLGYESAEELYALPSTAMLYWSPADRDAFLRRLMAFGEVRDAEYELRRRDGERVVVLMNARAIRDAAGHPSSIEGTVANITERKRAERQVFEEKERAQVTLQSIGEAVISTDATGLIDYMNPIAESLTGWTLFEARGQAISQVLRLIDESSRADLESPVLRCLREGTDIGNAEHAVLQSRTGQDVAIHNSAAPIRNRAGEAIGAVTVFRDVTKERRLKRALSYQAAHDALTGLINRREFDARLQDAVESVRRGEGPHVLLYVDLDQFKVVNDTCGHPAGDRLLRDVTALLQARVRTADTIARLGGDEFGILLENCAVDQAQKVAESIRAGIRDYRFVWNDNAMNIGASIGMVTVAEDTESVASLMSAADIACYAAKDSGRNRVHLYERSEATGRHREMYWVARVTRAVEEGRLALHAQPIRAVNPGTGGQPGAFHELLVRLRDERGELVAPGEFIPAAERYNVMSAIDRWVVQRAIQLLDELPGGAEGGHLLAVNLSGTSLNDPAFIEFLLTSLEAPRIARGLCFEITETAAVANLHQAVYFMGELRSRGCRFALDDFGSGLSSFRYLKTLPVDFLKIDGQFIGQVASDPVDRSMVEAICQVGRTLGIHTIAERVESPEVLASLQQLGVDYAQGWHLGRPQPIETLITPR
jgi:diguanylate cyclase (GGDEF)-like protein/PAS domain S-box-containing protein